MTQPTVWWLLAGALIVVELLTSSFYLLMIAIGLAAAATAAHLGAPPTVQIVVAAVVGGGAVVALYAKRSRWRKEPSTQANVNMNLDIGEIVHIKGWNSDGTTNVQYRGANWTVMHHPGVVPSDGAHRVTEVIGNRLVVEKSQ